MLSPRLTQLLQTPQVSAQNQTSSHLPDFIRAGPNNYSGTQVSSRNQRTRPCLSHGRQAGPALRAPLPPGGHAQCQLSPSPHGLADKPPRGPLRSSRKGVLTVLLRPFLPELILLCGQPPPSPPSSDYQGLQRSVHGDDPLDGVEGGPGQRAQAPVQEARHLLLFDIRPRDKPARREQTGS